MARRKNTKRIDPRYFLHETTHRDLEEDISVVRPGAPELAGENSIDEISIAHADTKGEDFLDRMIGFLFPSSRVRAARDKRMEIMKDWTPEEVQAFQPILDKVVADNWKATVGGEGPFDVWGHNKRPAKAIHQDRLRKELHRRMVNYAASHTAAGLSAREKADADAAAEEAEKAAVAAVEAAERQKGVDHQEKVERERSKRKALKRKSMGHAALAGDEDLLADLEEGRGKMKITNSQLKQIIKEEVSKVMGEVEVMGLGADPQAPRPTGAVRTPPKRPQGQNYVPPPPAKQGDGSWAFEFQDLDGNDFLTALKVIKVGGVWGEEPLTVEMEVNGKKVKFPVDPGGMSETVPQSLFEEIVKYLPENDPHRRYWSLDSVGLSKESAAYGAALKEQIEKTIAAMADAEELNVDFKPIDLGGKPRIFSVDTRDEEAQQDYGFMYGQG
jgi:hypothetical protein